MTSPLAGNPTEVRELQAQLAAMETRLRESEEKLAEAQELIRAIQSGEVDAVVVSGPKGEQIFTLKDAEYSYRSLVEAMSEGAATLAADGTVLYCNQQMSYLLGLPIEQVIGQSAVRMLLWDDAENFQRLLTEALNGNASKAAMNLETADGRRIPIQISLKRTQTDEAATVSMVVTDLSEIRNREEALQLQSSQLRALGERMHKVREEDRRNIARDLHDRLGQILTAIKMDLSWIARHAAKQQDGIDDRLARSIYLISEGSQAVHKICQGLRPLVLDDLGLAAAIESEAKEFISLSGIPCVVSAPDGDLSLDGDVSITLFRIFQECLTNIMRHSEAHSVRVSLERKEAEIRLEVADDGKGFSEAASSGSLGLLGMKERAQTCGGKLTLATSPGAGTTVTVSVPIDHRSDGPGVV